MLVSIVIPVYNIQDYIGRCLDTCLAQTAKGGYEIICVNDGSTDNSLAVLREYESEHAIIRVIDKPNGGVSSARNAGIREALGEYIWFVDGDDWIAEGSVERIEETIHKLEKQPDCVLFGYKRTAKYENVSVLDEKIIYEAVESGYAEFRNKYLVEVWCRWFRTSTVRNNAVLFDETIAYSEDVLFVSVFNSFCKSSLVIEKTIYYYFQRTSSARHQLNASKYCISMFKLSKAYKNTGIKTDNKELKKRMHNAVIRAMQAACRALCIYCSDGSIVSQILKELKKKDMYPYGVDWKQFRRDKKQSVKNDIMNWMFGLLSFEPYFWVCWCVCSIIFFSHRRSVLRETQAEILQYLAEAK